MLGNVTVTIHKTTSGPVTAGVLPIMTYFVATLKILTTLKFSSSYMRQTLVLFISTAGASQVVLCWSMKMSSLSSSSHYSCLCLPRLWWITWAQPGSHSKFRWILYAVEIQTAGWRLVRSIVGDVNLKMYWIFSLLFTLMLAHRISCITLSNPLTL